VPRERHDETTANGDLRARAVGGPAAPGTAEGLSTTRRDEPGGRTMTIEEAKKVVEQTRSFICRIFANEVVLDGPFKPLELEAILFLMRNRPAPPE
jgi:hypothetical protein